MGIAATKQRVRQHLHTSQAFMTSCTTVFSDLQILNGQRFPEHIFTYQLPEAAKLLHLSLSHSVPLINTWCPDPLPDSLIYPFFQSLTLAFQDVLNYDQFEAFAVALFTDAVVSNASKKVASRVGIGSAGIAAFGFMAGVRGGVAGSLIGVYALGVATSVYLGLGSFME